RLAKPDDQPSLAARPEKAFAEHRLRVRAGGFMLGRLYRHAARTALCALFIVASGCGKPGPTIDIPVYPAQGKLIVEGNPYAGISVVLVKVEDVADRGGFGKPTIRGMTSEDGTFHCNTVLIKPGTPAQQAPGAPPGEYIIVCRPEDEEHPLVGAFTSG